MELPFLREIIGNEGTDALNKAIDTIPVIGTVVVPRAIVSWLSILSKMGYEGAIPGVSNSYFSLIKSENQTLTGALTINSQLYTFEGADLLHVAASLGVALGIDLEPVDGNLKYKDLTKLGKSIDLLVKSEFIKKAKALKKADDDDLGTQAAPANKQDEPLKQAKALLPTKQPSFNVKSSANGPQQKENIALGQGQKIKVTKSESTKQCEECGGSLFKDEKFTGCVCLKELSKGVKTQATPDGYMLTFRNLEEDELIALIQIIKD